MNKPRAIFWICATVIYTIGTFYLSSQSHLPRIMVRDYHLDWFLHAIEYGILGVLVMVTFDALGMNSRMQSIVITVIFCGVVGGLNEIYQQYVPRRSATLGDEVANLIGVAVFLGGYFLTRRLRKSKSNKRVII